MVVGHTRESTLSAAINGEARVWGQNDK
jgi:hypothetical protein